MPSTVADPVPVEVDPGPIDEPHIHVVAAVLRDVSNPAHFLIAQRQKGKHLQDLWEFPGGKLEPGESRWSALCRELREEIGIEANAGDPLLRVYCRYPEVNVLLDVWTVSAYRGTVRAKEGQQLAWITAEAIDDYSFPPADHPILELIGYSASAES